jgi:hypothetical protein
MKRCKGKLRRDHPSHRIMALARLMIVMGLMLTAMPASAGSLSEKKQKVPLTVENYCMLSDRYRRQYVDEGRVNKKPALIALKLAQDAWEMDNTSVYPHLSMTKTYMAMGNNEEAVKSIKRAALQPGNLQVQELMGKLGLRVRKKTKSFLFSKDFLSNTDPTESEKRLYKLLKDNQTWFVGAGIVLLLSVLFFLWISYRFFRGFFRLFTRGKRTVEA